jgi:hypothetical protein
MNNLINYENENMNNIINIQTGKMNENAIQKKKMFVRVSKEISDLYHEYNDIHAQYYSNTDSHIITIQDEGSTYSFYISSNYPFSRPEIFVNNVPYKDTIVFKCPRINNYLKQYISGCCLYCRSIAVSKNWTPIRYLKNIMTEIKTNEKLKEKVINRKLIHEIKVKYNIPHEIRLEKWLHT